jgi:hypothetical protein
VQPVTGNTSTAAGKWSLWRLQSLHRRLSFLGGLTKNAVANTRCLVSLACRLCSSEREATRTSPISVTKNHPCSICAVFCARHIGEALILHHPSPFSNAIRLDGRGLAEALAV